jgi:predicted AlkP superfamily pyrophosphatase or phosphodiesterase
MVVMVSLDGLRALTLADPQAPIPTLRGLVARGARARSMRPVFPSVTWPCHTSLVTGVAPARHGVLGNHVFDRGRGEIVSHYGDRTDVGVGVETLWDRVHASGGRVAGVCWPKTRGVAAVADNIPEFYEQELFEKYASPELWRELQARGLPVGCYGPWSTRHAFNPMQDWLTLEAARHVLATRPPQLMLVHFLTLDAFQHDYGVGSPEARWALQHVDALLARLLDGLDTTTFVIFGDHGFVDVSTTYHMNVLLREEGLIDFDARGHVTRRHAWVAGNGGAGHVYVLDGAPRTTVDRVRERFAALAGLEVLGADEFAALGLPAPSAHSAQGDLVVRAAPGYQVTGYATREIAAAAPLYRATHGHDPRLPELGAALLLAGPGVRDGVTMDEVSMLDVAPTVAHLLGIDLPGADGRVLTEAVA